jgi:predicted O-methyltransferase YrrM
MKTLYDWSKEYEDTEENSRTIVENFRKATDEIKELKEHRDFIEYHQKELGIIYGHGDRSLSYFWKLLIDEMPENFKFLEIGVYKGQILSLIQMLANSSFKNPKIYGVTPLFDPDFANYNRLPYIEKLFEKFNLTMKNTTVIDGLSQNPEIIEKVKETAPYDIIYVDGDHSYAATVSDIENYGAMLKIGGFMVVDDCNNNKKISNEYYGGIHEVSLAVGDCLEKNPNYQEILTCMHVRVWQKINDITFCQTINDYWEENE